MFQRVRRGSCGQDNPNFDSTLKLLITMGLAFMVIAAFYAAKTIRDNAIPGRVQSTDWMLAVGAIVFSVGFTFFALFNSWDDLVRSCPPLPPSPHLAADHHGIILSACGRGSRSASRSTRA